MLTTFIAICLLRAQAGATQGQTAQGPTASGIISKMLGHYASAKTVSGTIKLVQTSMGKSAEVDTQVAFEKPTFMYLVQSTSDGKAPVSLVSDGVQFAYSPPPTLDKAPPKLVESVNQTVNGVKVVVTIPEMYAIAKQFLRDSDAPLDIAFARERDLRALVSELKQFKLEGKAQVGDQSVNVIQGMRIGRGWPTMDGTFEMDVSDAGDLVGFSLNYRFGVDAKWLMQHKLPANAYPQGIEVVSKWEISLKVDQQVDHALFHL